MNSNLFAEIRVKYQTKNCSKCPDKFFYLTHGICPGNIKWIKEGRDLKIQCKRFKEK